MCTEGSLVTYGHLPFGLGLTGFTEKWPPLRGFNNLFFYMLPEGLFPPLCKYTVMEVPRKCFWMGLIPSCPSPATPDTDMTGGALPIKPHSGGMKEPG